MVAANAPDIDVLAFAWGPYHALAFRRGITHGVPGLIALSLVVSGGVIAWDRTVRRKRNPDAIPVRPRSVLLLAVLGLLSHPALDWLNSYGIRWWLPFDGGWSYGDALFIVDPWLWLLLGGALFLTSGATARGRRFWALAATLCSALVLLAPVGLAARGAWLAGVAAVIGFGRVRRGSAASGGSSPDGDRRLVRAATVLGAAYIAGMTLLSGLAARDARDAVPGAANGDVMVGPVPASPIRREILGRSGDRLIRGTHSWVSRPRAELSPGPAVSARTVGAGIALEEVDRALAAARALSDVEDFLLWSRFPFVSIDRTGDGYRVHFGDARYFGLTGGSLSGIDVHLSAAFDPILNPPG